MSAQENTEKEQNWRYILLNGQYKSFSVLNPQFDKGELISIEDLKPFERKNEAGEDVQPTVDDANDLKRSAYIDFFKKPFKNLLILSGAGSSIDVGGPMITLSRDYNPATRALLGAVLNYYRPVIKTNTLLSSLNPLTKFKIGISDKVLGTKQKWNIV